MTRFSSQGPGAQARRVAAAVLEVLAGARTPTQAAEALSVSLPRYYALEGRALEGLLRSCEPRAKGPRRSAEREVLRLQKEVQRLEREGARTQALLRAAQRAVGLSALRTPPAEAKPGRKRRRRKPVARALRAARILRDSEGKNSVEPQREGGDNVPQETT